MCRGCPESWQSFFTEQTLEPARRKLSRAVSCASAACTDAIAFAGGHDAFQVVQCIGLGALDPKHVDLELANRRLTF